MRKLFSHIILLLTAIPAAAQQALITVDNAYWMPADYLEAHRQHPPEDTFWRTVDFAGYLSPVASMLIVTENGRKQHASMYTYGADYFPMVIKKVIAAPGRKQWILDPPVFSGGNGAKYQGATFSLISHRGNKQDLWLGIRYQDGRQDSIRFAKVPESAVNAPWLWLHQRGYIAYCLHNKQFNVYNGTGKLLYENVKTGNNYTLSGIPGYNAWDISSGNQVTLYRDGRGSEPHKTYETIFKGNDIWLRPWNTSSTAEQILVLKEDKQVH